MRENSTGKQKNDVRANKDQERMNTGLDHCDKDETGLEAIEPAQEAHKKTNPKKL